MEVINLLADLAKATIKHTYENTYLYQCRSESESFYESAVNQRYLGLELESTNCTTWKELDLKLYKTVRFVIPGLLNDYAYNYLIEKEFGDVSKVKSLIENSETLSSERLYFSLKHIEGCDIMDNTDEDIILSLITSKGEKMKNVLISLTMVADPELVDLMVEYSVLPTPNDATWFYNVLKVEDVKEAEKVQLRRLFTRSYRILRLLE